VGRGSRLLLCLALAAGVGCGSEPTDPSERTAPAPSVEATPPTLVPRSSDRPDVVLVSIDSLRADHLSSYGYARETSPTIDGLAARGVRFASAISTTSWTLPAHAALFTGLYDSAHGVDLDGRSLGDESRTLAEAFRDAGWRTAGFFGGPYLHPSFGLAQGFDVWQSCMTRIPDEASEIAVQDAAREGRDTAHADVTGPRLLAEVERWAEGLDGEPFFLFVHMWDVHYDFIPPPGYVERFDPDYDGPIDGRGFVHDDAIRADMAPRDLEHLVALYDAEILYTDEVLGRILALLDARGRLDGTLVVVTADHGEEFFDHGGKGHRRTLFDEVVRVPLVVYWPGRLPEGRVVSDQVRLIDLMPTVLSLVGVPLPGPVQGRDLTPLLEGDTLPPAPALTELRRRNVHLRALRTGERKLVDRGGPRAVLYDLVRDPEEAHPSREPSEEAERLRARLASELEAARRFRERARPATPTLDPEVVERLRRLGYLDDESEEASGDAP
jgi:arylsulfatase A-like enzyme